MGHHQYKTPIERTHKISSSIEIFNVGCNKLKQLLINNVATVTGLYLTASLKKYVQHKLSYFYSEYSQFNA